MLSKDRFRGRWDGRSPTVLMFVLVLLVAAACDDGDHITNSNRPGPFELMFSLDGSFQALHGGQPIRMALVRSTDGFVVAQEDGTVSATQDPSFFFESGEVMEKRVPYELHYWIDSNIGGGTPGTCDPREIDHQWSVEFPRPTNDVDLKVRHNPALIEDVCDTFD